MGYRSEVACLIYGPKEKMDGFVMKHIHTASFNVFTDAHDGFAEALSQWEDGDGRAFIQLHGDDWKWYDGYASVDAWTEFMNAAPEHGLAVEFIRIGEEDTDVVVERMEGEGANEGEGQEVEWLLNVSRSVSFNVAPPEETSDAQAATG